MLKWLLSSLMASGAGERFDGGTGGDLASLTSALKAEKDKNKGEGQLSRLNDAFKQLKDMHKDNAPFDFENAQWPYGPIGAPSQAMAQADGPSPLDNAQWPHGPRGAPSQAMAAAHVPMPMARPAEAPQASSPIADFFARNTAMMKDPNSGQFIDPSAAAKHGGSPILNGMFG